jgi:hypothetical protein
MRSEDSDFTHEIDKHMSFASFFFPDSVCCVFRNNIVEILLTNLK